MYLSPKEIKHSGYNDGLDTQDVPKYWQLNKS